MKSDGRYSTKFRNQRSAMRFSSFLLITLLGGINAWYFREMPIIGSKPCCSSGKHAIIHSRRDFIAIASAFSCSRILFSDGERVNAAESGLDPKQRFVAARKDLRDLIDDYSEITKKGGGDAVRNRLGTQGVNSNLFGIQKILKILSAEAEDIVEYTETMEEFNAYYFQAEGAAYQSLFVEHSSAKSTPESLLQTAKADIIQMEKYMDRLAVQLNL